MLPPASRGPAPADGHEADPLERLELALEREKIKGRQAIALLSDFAALEARTREALDSLECPSYRVLDGCEAPEMVWLVVEPMVGTNGSIRGFRHQNTAKSYSGHGTRGTVTGPYSRHTLPSTGDVELARQVLRENFDGRPHDAVGPFRDAHNVPAIAYELGRRDGAHAEQLRAIEVRGGVRGAALETCACCVSVRDTVARSGFPNTDGVPAHVLVARLCDLAALDVRAGVVKLIARRPPTHGPEAQELVDGLCDALEDLLAGKKIESTG